LPLLKFQPSHISHTQQNVVVFDLYTLYHLIVVRGWKSGPHSLWMWSFAFTQMCVSGLLLFGSRGHYEYKSGGHLEL